MLCAEAGYSQARYAGAMPFLYAEHCPSPMPTTPAPRRERHYAMLSGRWSLLCVSRRRRLLAMPRVFMRRRRSCRARRPCPRAGVIFPPQAYKRQARRQRRVAAARHAGARGAKRYVAW